MRHLSYLYGMKQLKPSEKSKEMTQFLELMAGRDTSIYNKSCVNPPFGCGQLITSFRDELSKREYKISGLCQKCQDKIFG